MRRGPWRLRDITRGTVVAAQVHEASSFWGRFRGLMGRRSLPAGEGLYLATNSIHMLFMRFPIDALFVSRPDADGSAGVVAVRPDLPPWRGIVLPVRGAAAVVELPAGALTSAGVVVGDELSFEPAGTLSGD